MYTLKAYINHLFLETFYRKLKNYQKTIAYPWCNNRSTNISTCGMWRDKSQDSSLQEGASHTYTFILD